MDNALKACPCCGSKAELKQAYYFESELPYSHVRCVNEKCALHQDGMHFSGSDQEQNSQNAITAWNQRKNIPALHD